MLFEQVNKKAVGNELIIVLAPHFGVTYQLFKIIYPTGADVLEFNSASYIFKIVQIQLYFI